MTDVKPAARIEDEYRSLFEQTARIELQARKTKCLPEAVDPNYPRIRRELQSITLTITRRHSEESRNAAPVPEHDFAEVTPSRSDNAHRD